MKTAIKARSVTVRQFYERRNADFRLRLLTSESALDRIIREPTVNRPGLVLAGFTKYFPHNRIQVIGNVEMHYLRSLPETERYAREDLLLSHRIPAVVFCRNYSPSTRFLERAEQLRIPVFKSPLVTMRFINRATLLLEDLFAPTAIEQGSMVDILGIGVIIKGESGIGKSECVLALIERGYSLVADDVTKVRLFEGREVIGTAPETTRNHMEVRGIGIINVPAMFGIRSVRAEKRVDLVVTLRPWRRGNEVDRTGIETETVKILGVDIPHMVIPVRPGRDIARLVEVAAYQTKLKKLGYNPAEEFNRRLIAKMAAEAAMPSGD